MSDLQYRLAWYQLPGKSLPSSVEGFIRGMEMIQTAMKQTEHRNLSCSLMTTTPNQSAASANIERLDSGYTIVQVFVSKDDSPNGEEGWFNLVQNPSLKISIEDDLVVGESREGFTSVKFAEGVMFSEKLFVPESFALSQLEVFRHEKQLKDWLSSEYWKFLGVV
jgi:hypothetical protein